MLEVVILLPFMAGILAMFLPVRFGRGLLLLVAFGHLLLSLLAWCGKLIPILPDYFSLTPEGVLILLVTSFIFLFISFYAVSYMKVTELPRGRERCSLSVIKTETRIKIKPAKSEAW